MHSSKFVEVSEQMMLLRLTLMLITPVVTALTGVTLAAFVLYLVGVCQLCRGEIKPSQKSS